MRKNNLILSAVCLLALMSMSVSCASRVVYVAHGEPVRLAQSVKAKVWVVDSTGKTVRSQNRIMLPEGWYALPKP
jgi:acid phosphatase class B